MLGVTCVCVGRLKEDYLRAACAEYTKRLGAYCKLNVIEIEEERQQKGQAEDAVRQAEAARILARLPGAGYVVALEVDGRQGSSEGLARLLSSVMTGGTGHITFIIGGSVGLAPEISRRADLALSFS
ncbi:MAG: 23S rRNA (pseudouridine(1915)-N(3))-methyltransferase RlmH, partial [Defluviitaleaceae bacterium]|nr:23S rRNA (pseudouridine(1915)-N(3))-methyltransferase RlmH [Defluviitaleaceae bacterium]